MNAPIIVLFRQDLRLKDNPALNFACQKGQPVIPLYILDDFTPGLWKMGGASRWWLHHSLTSLDRNLREKGSQLFLHQGETVSILSNLIKKYPDATICWNRCYEPYAIQLEQKIKKLHLQCQSFNGSLLFEPWEVLNQQQQPFKIFTPFWRRCMEIGMINDPLPDPSSIPTKIIESEHLDSFKLLPHHPDWSGGLQNSWNPGEKSVNNKLGHFIAHSLKAYAQGRDIPGEDSTSLLSPHLHFGEVSPRQIYHIAKHLPDSSKFLSEIGWREFSYYQLYHFPQLPEQPWRPEFSNFSWEKNDGFLKKWQKGETGYPIVDAGMRQLWKSGWMHNRVRMICASFLIKDLFLSWQEGAKWFWDTLVDADLANNSASWQWVAGCGFDAAPFFRIFNPVLQSEKFDPDGTYIRRWVPELADVSAPLVHTPWKAGPDVKFCYSSPIVDHAQARKQALEKFKSLSRDF
ncbi:MAG: deoxyribodipyrimidine photo-lyase [Candidatus Protochlamydia sp.]|nr:deoxyribodipyrimidine photo-lyase [Candidatus Protochlamydia sp.]